MARHEDLLFVLGAGKTASTALCGLLNSHPDVFVMCEVGLNESRISRYGTKLLNAYPEFLPCFFQAFGTDEFENYRKAHRLLREMGHAKRYFGDKFVGIDSGYARRFQRTRVVFSARRLPEWIAKDSVRSWFPLDLDAVPFAVQYAKHFVESFLLPHVYHVRMEEFLGDNAAVVEGIWSFLGLEPPANAEKWWETIGHYPAGDPKTALNWWRGHASSAVSPQENDTQIELRPSAFWDQILPIFDKYYDGVRQRVFERAEIEADLAKLQDMIGHHHQPLESCFVTAASQSHNERFKNKRRAKSGTRTGRIKRILRKVGIR